MNSTLVLITLLSVMVLAGCTTISEAVTEDNESVTNVEVQSALSDFESTLIGENDDVEIGSLI